MQNKNMDLDILEEAQLMGERGSEDEDSVDEESDGVEDTGSTTLLDVLKDRVEDNLKLLRFSSAVDPSPLTLANLKEKFPQVARCFLLDFSPLYISRLSPRPQSGCFRVLWTT